MDYLLTINVFVFGFALGILTEASIVRVQKIKERKAKERFLDNIIRGIEREVEKEEEQRIKENTSLN